MILKICSDLDDSMTSWFWDILNRSLNNTGLKLSHYIVPFSFVYCAHWKGVNFSAGGHTVPKNIANTGNINLSRIVVMLLCVPSLSCNLLEGTDKALLELKLDTLPHLVTFGFCITRPHELFPVCEQCFLLDFFTLVQWIQVRKSKVKWQSRVKCSVRESKRSMLAILPGTHPWA